MQGSRGSSTSSLSLLSTGLTLSTTCVTGATRPGKIGTLCATIGAVFSTMLVLVMRQGCIVVSMGETIVILLGVAVKPFVQFACAGMQNIVRSWLKLA